MFSSRMSSTEASLEKLRLAVRGGGFGCPWAACGKNGLLVLSSSVVARSVWLFRLFVAFLAGDNSHSLLDIAAADFGHRSIGDANRDFQRPHQAAW